MPHHIDDHRERPEHVVTAPNSGGRDDDSQESNADNKEDAQRGGSGSEIDRDPGVARADESRERPEQAVTDNTTNKGGIVDDPAVPGHREVIKSVAINAAVTRKQNPSQDDDDNGKEDTRHNLLKSAIDQGADAADPER